MIFAVPQMDTLPDIITSSMFTHRAQRLKELSRKTYQGNVFIVLQTIINRGRVFECSRLKFASFQTSVAVTQPPTNEEAIVLSFCVCGCFCFQLGKGEDRSRKVEKAHCLQSGEGNGQNTETGYTQVLRDGYNLEQMFGHNQDLLGKYIQKGVDRYSQDWEEGHNHDSGGDHIHETVE